MNHKSASVLVVEDELLVAGDLQQSLGDMGYDAFAVAASADEAWACADQRWPDVVLMDIRIKGKKDGIQVAKLLKRKNPVIVIFLTAHADDATIHRAKQAEPDGYLVKPVQTAELRCVIEVALYKRQLNAERERRYQAEVRLLSIVNNAPLSVAYFDSDGSLRFANQAFRDLLAENEAQLSSETMEALRLAVRKPRSDPTRRTLDLADGEQTRKFELTQLPDRDTFGTVRGLYTIAYDITLHERLTAELQRARLDLETILNATPARITSWQPDLTNRFANLAAERWFGVARGKAAGRHLSELVGPEQFDTFRSHFESAKAGNSGSQDHVEGDVDGPRYWHDEYIPEVRDSAVTVMFALSVDTTDSRSSHARIRLLAQRLETVREEERRAVAVRLHDGIAQDLFALKLGFHKLRKQLEVGVSDNQLCADLEAGIVLCMDDTRQIANDLRPTGLLHFGISGALAEHVKLFAARAKLEISFKSSEILPPLDDGRQLLLFRAAQEALTNVARHAHATSVSVELLADSERITLSVSDDGVGITGEALRKPRSLGLLALRERFEALGGGVTSKRGSLTGTISTFFLPNPLATLQAQLDRI